jgi:hypothetical protein
VVVPACVASILFIPTAAVSATQDPNGPQSPDTVCTDPPAWDYDAPTISGSAVVGYTITSSSGNVWCANSLKATFYRTDSSGNILATVKTGATQTCSNVGFSDCIKADTYQLTASEATRYIKVTWTATNAMGSPTKTTNPVFGQVVSNTGTPPTNTGAPSISGTLVPGHGVSCTNGSWTGATSFVTNYQNLPYANLSQYDQSVGIPIRTDFTGSQLRCRVVAANQYGSTETYSARTTGRVSLAAITYGIYIDGNWKQNFEVAFPGCDDGTLCAAVGTFLEAKTSGDNACPTFDATLSGWSSSGGPKTSLTPNYHLLPSGSYPPLTSGPGTATSWHFTAPDNSIYINSCSTSTDTYWIKQDQGTGPTQELVNGPPTTIGPVTLLWSVMHPRGFGHTILAPAIADIGNFTGGALTNDWIEAGYFSGYMDSSTGCSAYLDPNVVYSYVETVVNQDSENTLACVTPPFGAVAHAKSSDNTWNIYWYNAIGSNSNHTFTLAYVSSR